MRGKALLCVSAELFVSALIDDGDYIKTFRVVENPLPKDVSVVGIYAADQRTLYIELESESYPPLDARGYHCGVPVLAPPRLQVIHVNEEP